MSFPAVALMPVPLSLHRRCGATPNPCTAIQRAHFYAVLEATEPSPGPSHALSRAGGGSFLGRFTPGGGCFAALTGLFSSAPFRGRQHVARCANQRRRGQAICLCGCEGLGFGMNTNDVTRYISMMWGVVLTIAGLALMTAFVLPFIGFLIGVVGLVAFVAGVGLIAASTERERTFPDEKRNI